MGKSKLKGKDLKKIGYPSDKAKSLALQLMNKHFKFNSKEEKLNILIELKNQPEDYLEHPTLAILAQEFVAKVPTKKGTIYKLAEEEKHFQIFGGKFINQNCIQQMDLAMKLPVAAKGALMPDAHQGYGLPIGGVMATENSVIPYGVGLDIGCRMSLTLYDAPDDFLKRYGYQVKCALKANTFFGIGSHNTKSIEHEVLDSSLFNEFDVLRQLQSKAARQIGSSGSGNHFVEFGEVYIDEGSAVNVPAGKYLGILAHSGSRSLGASIAQYYTRVAMDQCILPKGHQHLAWLDLDSEAGQEYWLAMNLAGDYAKACHDVIHAQLAKELGLKAINKIENHHNFAWKEQHTDGKEWVVHRKGATPAHQGQLGIIPSSMCSSGYIVSGLGNESSLYSASHGAGRKMTRTKARSSITNSAVKKLLSQHKIQLIGGGVDEAPMVYKDIEHVMQAQTKLVKIEGRFDPKIVRMDKA